MAKRKRAFHSIIHTGKQPPNPLPAKYVGLYLLPCIECTSYLFMNYLYSYKILIALHTEEGKWRYFKKGSRHMICKTFSIHRELMTQSFSLKSRLSFVIKLFQKDAFEWTNFLIDYRTIQFNRWRCILTVRENMCWNADVFIVFITQACEKLN